MRHADHVQPKQALLGIKYDWLECHYSVVCSQTDQQRQLDSMSADRHQQLAEPGQVLLQEA